MKVASYDGLRFRENLKRRQNLACEQFRIEIDLLDFEALHNKSPEKKTKTVQHWLMNNLRVEQSLRCQVIRDWTTRGFKKLKGPPHIVS